MSESRDPTFTASHIATAFTGGDLFTLLSTAASRVEVERIELQQVATDVHPMYVEIFRGTTSVGAGGADLPVANHFPWGRAPVTEILGPPTAGNSTALATRVAAGGIDADGRYAYEPCVPMGVDISENLHLRLSTSTLSTAGVTMSLAVTFRETGKLPV
jgi:hypothetical protein